MKCYTEKKRQMHEVNTSDGTPQTWLEDTDIERWTSYNIAGVGLLLL